MSRLTREESGFTLVELLVVSVLMIVVLSATLGAFETFGSTNEVNQRQNDSQEEARRSIDSLARELRNLASPTNQAPEAVDRAEGDDLIFLSVADQKGVGSLNARNAQRVRYCLNRDRRQLIRQVQTWTSPGVPGVPTDSACPGGGWTETRVASIHIVNGSRPVFTLNSSDRTAITEIDTSLFVDVNPGRRPAETPIQTSVFLRNQNKAPVARFSWAAGPGGTVVLNASESEDPEERALTFEWYDATLGQRIDGTGIVNTYKPPAAGFRQVYLVVKDPAGLEARAEPQTICVPSPQMVCPS